MGKALTEADKALLAAIKRCEEKEEEALTKLINKINEANNK